jgi:hypothetical protein
MHQNGGGGKTKDTKVPQIKQMTTKYRKCSKAHQNFPFQGLPKYTNKFGGGE